MKSEAGKPSSENWKISFLAEVKYVLHEDGLGYDKSILPVSLTLSAIVSFVYDLWTSKQNNGQHSLPWHWWWWRFPYVAHCPNLEGTIIILLLLPLSSLLLLISLNMSRTTVNIDLIAIVIILSFPRLIFSLLMIQYFIIFNEDSFNVISITITILSFSLSSFSFILILLSSLSLLSFLICICWCYFVMIIINIIVAIITVINFCIILFSFLSCSQSLILLQSIILHTRIDFIIKTSGNALTTRLHLSLGRWFSFFLEF